MKEQSCSGNSVSSWVSEWGREDVRTLRYHIKIPGLISNQVQCFFKSTALHGFTGLRPVTMYWKKYQREFFRPFLTKPRVSAYFSLISAKYWRPKVVESWKIFWRSFKQLSKLYKNFKSLLASCPECQPFIKSDVFFGTPCITLWLRSKNDTTYHYN